jgi:hypothetical protein
VHVNVEPVTVEWKVKLAPLLLGEAGELSITVSGTGASGVVTGTVDVADTLPAASLARTPYV